MANQRARDAGYYFITDDQYLQDPFKIPTTDATEDEVVTDQGIVNTNAFANSGGGSDEIYGGPIDNLITDYNTAIDKRQARLENPDPFAQKIYDMGFPQQRSVDQMMRDATAYNMNELGPSFSQIGITNNMTGQQIKDAMAEYAADETSIGNYPVDNPLDVRKNMPLGITGILSGMFPSSYHDKFTMPEQIYTQSQMGYKGPTVFGKNTGQQDIFGRNIISGTGNYAKKQAKDIQKLDDLFASNTFTDKYGDLKLEEDEDGIYSFTGGTKKQIDLANKMHKLNLIRYNYDKQGLKKLEDIKTQTGFTDIMKAKNPGTTDYGITQGVSDADYTGGGNLDRAIDNARQRSDNQDRGNDGPGQVGSSNYNDPYDPGGGE